LLVIDVFRCAFRHIADGIAITPPLIALRAIAIYLRTFSLSPLRFAFATLDTPVFAVIFTRQLLLP